MTPSKMPTDRLHSAESAAELLGVRPYTELQDIRLLTKPREVSRGTGGDESTPPTRVSPVE